MNTAPGTISKTIKVEKRVSFLFKKHGASSEASLGHHLHPTWCTLYLKLLKIKPWYYLIMTRGAMVVGLTTDQKFACSNHVGVKRVINLADLTKVSEQFGMSKFWFSAPKLVELDPHIAYIGNLVWKGLHWFEKDYIGLKRTALAWKGLHWFEKDYIGLKRTTLVWNGLHWFEKDYIDLKRITLVW